MHYNSVILIPAYNPDEKLLKLIDDLTSNDTYKNIIIVNDGSINDSSEIFNKVDNNNNCTLLLHEVNKGKGQSIKTGLKYCIDNYTNDSDFNGVVTADADGQHTPDDIKSIAKSLHEHSDKLIIGTRKFDKSTPLRSRFGNAVTSFVYWLASRVKINDTQTGLRGMPAGSLDKFLEVKGDRYEYEMNVLLNLKKTNLQIFEVPIEVIYIDDNKSSHFNPIRDSIRIYSTIIKYGLSSIISVVIDFAIYYVLITLKVFDAVKLPYIIGKVVSSFFNFTMNRNVVFKRGRTETKDFVKDLVSYYALFFLNLFLGTYLNAWLVNLGVSQYLSKLISEPVLFLFSYIVQKKIIFKNKK